ncbi:MAG: hypothetical protein GC185_00505 [Alphaproteobacteria bacterium]|nr:hypothetical protein [Alphaproteobacteria bacterium]
MSASHNLPPERNLNPIFGIYCRTETMALKNRASGSCHIHYEAVMDDPVKKTWSVAKVVNVHDASFHPVKDKNKTTVSAVKRKISFAEAVKILAEKEAELKKQAALYATSIPDAPMMGFIHYKAFAEREGYVFDETGLPHPRPGPRALPLGCTFLEKDVESANDNLQRPDNEFDGTGPAEKVPQTHFLLDQFTRAAQKTDFDAALAGVRMMNLLDGFVDHIEAAHKNMQDYCKNYHDLGQGALMQDAERSLQQAEVILRQLKAYGMDTKDFDGFLTQCEITCAVLHAEGLYDLMNRGLGDFTQNELQFKARVDQALEAFRRIDGSEDGMKTLKNMIVQTPKPEVPYAIGHFIDTYRKQRQGFTPAPAAPEDAPKNKPAGPKPPGR